MSSHTECNPEPILDLILFNTSTIVQEHSKEIRDMQDCNLKCLSTEIKTLEAQLDSTLLTKPLTAAQDKYHNNLNNKLAKLKQELQHTQSEIYKESYLAEPEADLMNPHKPSKELKKTSTRSSNLLSEIYIDQADPPHPKQRPEHSTWQNLWILQQPISV